MNTDWLTAFEALKRIYIEGAYSNIAVNEAVSHYKGCRDSFVRNMVKGILRDSMLLDHFIDRLAAKGVKSIRKHTLIILRMGIFAIRSLDSVPEYAAVNEAVALARRKASGTERFVNGMLRSYLRKKQELDTELEACEFPMALRYSFPESIADLLRSQYGADAESIMRGLNQPPSVYIRANLLKTDVSELMKLLKDEGIEAEPDDGCRAALRVAGRGITDSKLYRSGYYTVQSLASMTAVSRLAPSSGDRVLDMCSAPGGKTTMMSELMGNRGHITACDIHQHRLELVKATAARLGSDIIDTVFLDGTVYEPSYEEGFDCILADVPCSGLGVIGSKPEIKIRTDTEAYSDLNRIQEAILCNAARYTKKGGRICYSTCTLNKNENEKVIEAVCRKLEYLRILEIRTILPYNNQVGFFYCILEKNA